jgi:hypothetical protein
MYKIYFRFSVSATFFILSFVTAVEAQYLENFDGTLLSEWRTATGDGDATSEIKLNEGYASIIVDASEVDEDKGEQVLYPPPKPAPDDFQWSVPVLEAGIIDKQYPDVNFSGWSDGGLSVLTTDGTKTIILRWDLDEFSHQTVSDYGTLELTLHSHYRTKGTALQEFEKFAWLKY